MAEDLNNSETEAATEVKPLKRVARLKPRDKTYYNFSMYEVLRIRCFSWMLFLELGTCAIMATNLAIRIQRIADQFIGQPIIAMVLLWVLTVLAGCWLYLWWKYFSRHLRAARQRPSFWEILFFSALFLICLWVNVKNILTLSIVEIMSDAAFTVILFAPYVGFSLWAEWARYRRIHPNREVSFIEYANTPFR